MGRLLGASKDALQKARDSILLAGEVYDKPAISFKSIIYITLMVVAVIDGRKELQEYMRIK